jgi:hypothetical protein
MENLYTRIVFCAVHRTPGTGRLPLSEKAVEERSDETDEVRDCGGSNFSS